MRLVLDDRLVTCSVKGQLVNGMTRMDTRWLDLEPSLSVIVYGPCGCNYRIRKQNRFYVTTQS